MNKKTQSQSKFKIQKITSQDAIKNLYTQNNESQDTVDLKKRKNTLRKVNDYYNPNFGMKLSASENNLSKNFNKYIPTLQNPPPKNINDSYEYNSASKLNTDINRSGSANSNWQRQLRMLSAKGCHRHNMSGLSDLSESVLKSCMLSPGRYVNSENIHLILEELENNKFTDVKRRLLSAMEVEEKEDKEKQRVKHHQTYNNNLRLLDEASSVFMKKVKSGPNFLQDQTKEQEVRNYFEGLEIQDYLLKDGTPKCIDFFEQKDCYIWMETYGKYFPMHLTSNLPGVNFEYHINFVNIADQINFDNYKKILDPNLIGKPGFMNPEDNNQNEQQPQLHHIDETAMQHQDQIKQDFNTRLVLKKVTIDNIIKPNNYYYHFKDQGDIIHVNKTKKIQDADQDVHFVILYIKAPKPCRVNFSVSFTSPKFLVLKEGKSKNLFGETHKKFLLGKQVDDAFLARRKKDLEKSKQNDIVKKNKSICAVYQEFKEVKTNKIQVESYDRAAQNKERYRSIRENKNAYMEYYLKKHDILKNNVFHQKVEFYRLSKIFMKIYMMKFAIRFFQVMEHIKKCYWQKKWQLFNRRVMMNRVVTIQRHFRTYLSNIFYNKSYLRV